MYNDDWGYAAFEVAGGGTGSKAVVCIGGLTDGLLSLRYMPSLAAAVAPTTNDDTAIGCGWRVFQPVLQSSYRGWGTGSLSEDAEDIDRFLECLQKTRGISDVVLLGHSTGCQDVVHFLATGRFASCIKGIVLQAPVSDREAVPLTCTSGGHTLSEISKFKELATSMVADGRGEEVMPRQASLLIGPPHPITAYRFHSLTGRMTDDDMFSSDLTDEELRKRLGHINVPTLIAVSVDDEYVPKSTDLKDLSGRMSCAMAAGRSGQVSVLAIESGGHSLQVSDGSNQFVAAVRDFVCDIGKKLNSTK